MAALEGCRTPAGLEALGDPTGAAGGIHTHAVDPVARFRCAAKSRRTRRTIPADLAAGADLPAAAPAY